MCHSFGMSTVIPHRGEQTLDTPSQRHLTQADLASRWRLSPRTLERWRWLKQGPAYLKIGGRVVYRLPDIEACETAQLRGGGQ